MAQSERPYGHAKAIRVIIVDPCKRSGQFTANRVDTIGNCDVIAITQDISEAYNLAEHQSPEIVLVDAAFARMAEFEVLLHLFKALSIRCIVTSPGVSPAPKAVSGHKSLQYSSVEGLSHASLAGASNGASNKAVKTQFPSDPPGKKAKRYDGGIILIGASTGGVDALIHVLSEFPKACPPTLVVQHTGEKFTGGLARLINGQVLPDVAEAKHGQAVRPGKVLIAPGGKCHLELAKSRPFACHLRADDLCNGHRPSVDRLFQSAVPTAKKVTATILTGMGKDGAAGLLALREAGAVTFGQDAATSTVYGMPRAAFEAGAVGRQLPLGQIGQAMLETRQVSG